MKDKVFHKNLEAGANWAFVAKWKILDEMGIFLRIFTFSIWSFEKLSQKSQKSQLNLRERQ
jgi:hypothetical protein